MPNIDRLRSQLQTPAAIGHDIDLPHGDLCENNINLHGNIIGVIVRF